jgi:hypothetical protein
LKTLFEIEWLGGAAERHYRRVRPEMAALPWGSLDVRGLEPRVVDAARFRWTQLALSEYRAALAFARVGTLLLEARAPLDLIGMASDFIADEVTHVELASRIAAEFGGGASLLVDTTNLLPPLPEVDALGRADSEVLRVSCIHEILSGAVALDVMRGVEHPLLREAAAIVARDEAHHSRLGTLYFEWAEDHLDDRARARLGDEALRELESLAPIWRGTTTHALVDERASQTGWLDVDVYRERLARAVREEIVPTLEGIGVHLDPARDRALV